MDIRGHFLKKLYLTCFIISGRVEAVTMVGVMASKVSDDGGPPAGLASS